MQLTMFAPPAGTNPASSFGRMCREFSARPTTHSAASLAHSLGPTTRYSRQGKDGRTLVLCLDPAGQSAGESSTPNSSAWPNAAAVCSLSQVLETGSIPARYFLSSTACAGILRRAAKRGKDLPEALAIALRSAAGLPMSPAR
jgi:hypothetical protein